MTGAIIGRDDELSVVRAFLDLMPTGVRALVLEGEPGIGKSTLWNFAVAAARERQYRVLVSRPAEAEQTMPYVVLGDLFADADPEVLAQLEAPRRRAFDSALLRAEADHPVDPRALGVAIRTLLPSLARPGLVVAIDDDQWMDASSMATLGFALRRSHDIPISLLLARRIEERPARPLETAIDTIGVERLRIGPLSVGAIQLLVRNQLDVAFPRHLLVRIHEASGGNPFYALELARESATDPSWDLTAPMAVPPSLHRLVAARLEALDPVTRQALLLIAAQGRMPVELLHTLGLATEVLEPAHARHLIESVDGVVSFTHPLLASAVYQGASEQDRRSAHDRLATALDDPVDRGRHLALASDVASDPLADELESASIAARDRGMALAAAELAEHSLRLTPTESLERRHRRAIAATHANLNAGLGGRARSIATDVLSRAVGGAQRAEALVLLSELEDAGPALALLQEALVEAEGNRALEAAIHAELAEVSRMTRGAAWTEPHAREALRLTEGLNDELLRAKLLLMLAQDSFERGDPDASGAVERAHELVTSLDNPQLLSWADGVMGWVLMSIGDYDRARDWLQRRLDYWGDRDEPARSQLLWLLALTEFWSGRWAIASEHASAVREISEQYQEVSTDHLSPALIALHRGEIEVARAHSERALGLAKGHILPQHMAILGVCDSWSGNATGALGYLVGADQAADLRRWDEPNMRWWRADYVETLLHLGRMEEAAQLTADWEAAATRVGRERVLAQALGCWGQIAAARGELSAAMEYLESAAARHHALDDPFNRGRALLALGTVRLRARQKRLARSALDDAVANFDALGAAGWAAVARGELARIGGRQRIDWLSPSELRVAELVAEGRTNHEIASILVLGERTVASHLTHIYAKLGIRSRTELVRELHAHASDPARGKVPTS